jgi:hypothetical protein
MIGMIRVRTKKGRRLVKIGLIIAYLCIMALMFLLGRSHTVLIDNNSIPGGVSAVDGCTISFGGDKPIEMFKGDRDKIMLRGQTHRVTVSFFDGREDVTGTISIPLFEDAVLVSIPAFISGGNAVSRFELYKPAEE